MPVAPPRELSAEQINFEALFLASQDVLIDYGFEIDRRDRRRGEVTGKPMVARHGLEFWRRDATTNSDMAEGMLQKIYIVPTVKIDRTPRSASQFQATVIVQRLRSSRPEETPHKARFVSTSPGGGAAGGPRVSGGSANFVHLSRDENLELQLEASILSASMLRRAQLAQGR